MPYITETEYANYIRDLQKQHDQIIALEALLQEAGEALGNDERLLVNHESGHMKEFVTAQSRAAEIRKRIQEALQPK